MLDDTPPGLTGVAIASLRAHFAVCRLHLRSSTAATRALMLTCFLSQPQAEENARGVSALLDAALVELLESATGLRAFESTDLRPGAFAALHEFSRLAPQFQHRHGHGARSTG